MSNNTKMFLICIGGGLVAAFLVAWSQGLFSAATSADVFRTLCDGFFTVGAMLLAFGGLRWTFNGGVMDGLGFSIRTGIQRMRFNYEEQGREDFGEYRRNREKKAKSPKALLLSGAVFLIIALALYCAYCHEL